MGIPVLFKEYGRSTRPGDLFSAFSNRPFPFLLESGMNHDHQGRYSFMGSDPFLLMSAYGRQITLIREGHSQVISGNPFDTLQELMDSFHLSHGHLPVPFAGGAVGYFSYELGRHLERLPDLRSDDIGMPEMCLGFYGSIVAIDHLADRTFLLASGLPETAPAAAERLAKVRLATLEQTISMIAGQRVAIPHGIPPAGSVQNALLTGEVRANFTPDGYCRAVQAAKDYISAGDIFVINLSQRLEANTTVAPLDLYRRLMQLNPAPFASFLPYPEGTLICASPERFLKLIGRQVTTRPIKGTRPRGKHPEEDECMRRELWESAKDRAELAMVIDLERNDLGRVCRPGTIRVPDLYSLETYPTVFHLVSTVVGELAPGRDAVDLLRASFPGGSITGAPKVRAMEIIEELEPVRRGAYTGAIGYLGFDGDADLNIVIRTMVLRNGRVYLQVGGGLTADSEPEAEYLETLDKAKALVWALGAGKGDLVSGGHSLY